MWKSGDVVSREDYRNLMIELGGERVKVRAEVEKQLSGFISKPLPPLIPLPPCGVWSDGTYRISPVITEQLNLYKIPKPVKPRNRWWGWIKLF